MLRVGIVLRFIGIASYYVLYLVIGEVKRSGVLCTVPLLVVLI